VPDPESVATADLEQPHLAGILPGGPHLSVSQLGTYHDCSLKYDLKYRQHVEREPCGPMIAGIAIHHAIEISEQAGWWQDPENTQGLESPTCDVFLAMLEDSVRKAGGPSVVRWGGRGGTEDMEWWRYNGVFMLQRYQAAREAMAENGWGAVEDQTEYQVKANVPGVARPIIGYLDKFLMHEVGEPLILDWKTGKVGNANPMQFATYARLLELIRGIHVTRGTAVFLRATTAQAAIKHMTFLPLVQRVDEIFAAMERSMDAGVFTPNTKAWCSTCEVRASCWYWQGQGGDPDG